MKKTYYAIVDLVTELGMVFWMFNSAYLVLMVLNLGSHVPTLEELNVIAACYVISAITALVGVFIECFIVKVEFAMDKFILRG